MVCFRRVERVLVIGVNQYSAMKRIFFLLAGVFFIWSAKRALSTGTVSLGLGSIKRSNLAPFFWLGVVLNIAVGLVCLTTSVLGADPW